MKRSSNDQPLKEVIEQLLDAYKLKDKLNEHTVIKSWEKVMGKMVAMRTEEISIRKGKLFVRLNSPALKEELKYAKEKIKEALNNEAGAQVIDEVIFA